MTLDELYGKVMADDELKAEFAKAAEDDKVAEWLAAQGVEATEDEIVAYLEGAANQKLSTDDVDEVAGGGYKWKELLSIRKRPSRFCIPI